MGPNLYGPSLLKTRRKTGLYKTKDQNENTIVLVLIPHKLASPNWSNFASLLEANGQGPSPVWTQKSWPSISTHKQ